jgi:hypothetical protein
VKAHKDLKYPWTAWIDAARFGWEAHSVIALRMMRLAAGGTLAAAEAHRMVAEKVVAGAQAQFAAGMAVAAGRNPHRVARAAARPYQRTVRANRRRLTRRN